MNNDSTYRTTAAHIHTLASVRVSSKRVVSVKQRAQSFRPSRPPLSRPAVVPLVCCVLPSGVVQMGTSSQMLAGRCQAHCQAGVGGSLRQCLARRVLLGKSGKTGRIGSGSRDGRIAIVPGAANSSVSMLGSSDVLRTASQVFILVANT